MGFLETYLIPFGVGIFTNLTTDKIKSIFSDNETSLKELFKKSVLDTLSSHSNDLFLQDTKTYKKLLNEIKKDETKLFIAIESVCTKKKKNFINIIEDNEYKDFMDNLYQAYNIEMQSSNDDNFYNETLQEIFLNYKKHFFNNLTTNTALSTILQEALKIDKIVMLLDKISLQINDFDEIRKILMIDYYKSNALYAKTRNDYDRYIANKYEYLELAGFSPKISGKDIFMKLSDVFIPLQINHQDTHVRKTLNSEISSDNFLPHSNDHMVQQDLKIKKSIESILNKQALVILGDPGSGKSTLMKYIATFIVQNRTLDWLYKDTIPILIRVSEYADWFKEYRKSLFDYMTNIDCQYKQLIEENFEYSNLLILIDGLDEITDSSIRNTIVKNIIDLKSRYPMNKYIVTSRIIGYRESSLNGYFIESNLLDFNENEIKQFALQWYLSIANSEINSKEDISEAEENEIKQKYTNLANELFQSISRNSSVIKFAKNPLLMTIIAMIFYQSKKLPNKRVELYDIATETFLENWVRVRFEENSKFKDKGSILEILPDIAFEIHTTSDKGLIKEEDFKEKFISLYSEINGTTRHESKKEFNEFKEFLEKYTGFFYRKDMEGDLYGFVHLTFEEYLSALELKSKWDLHNIDLKDYIFDARWTEVIRLAVANLKISNKGKSGRAKATQFINDILNIKDDLFPESYRTIQMVLLILVDDVEINNEEKEQIIKQFFTILETCEYDNLISNLAKIFGEILYSLYSNDFLTILEKRINETNNSLFLKNSFLLLVLNINNKDVTKLLYAYLEKKQYIDYFFDAIQNLDYKRLCNMKIKEKIFLDSLRKYLQTNQKNQRMHAIIRILLRDTNFNHSEEKEEKYVSRIQKIIYYINNERDEKLQIILYQALIDECGFIGYRTKVNSNIFNTLKNKYYREQIKKINNFWYKEETKNAVSLQTSFKGYFRLCKTSTESLIYDLKNLKVYNVSKALDIKKLDESNNDKEEYCQFIDHISGHDQPNNVDIFINNYNKGIFFYFFGWEDFAIKNLHLHPNKLSKILIETYSIQNNYSINKNEKYFDNIKSNTILFNSLVPPIRLLILKKLNEPIENTLIDSCLEYFRNLDSGKEKNGVFALLFEQLNPYNI